MTENPRSVTPLYHYTTQEGLIGILKKKELWCSQVHYLNDSSEFRYALDLINNQIKYRIKNQNARSVRSKLEHMCKEVNKIQFVNVFVFSLSSRGNQLSQWRAYGGYSSGFSIGFDSDGLRNLGTQSRFWLNRCIYNPKEHKKLISDLIKIYLDNEEGGEEKLRSVVRVPPMGGETITMFIKQLTSLASVIKHPSFHEEAEWRLISEPVESDHPKCDVRRGPSMLVPFFKLNLRLDGGGLPISKVIVGPTPHPDLAKSALISLMSRNGIPNPNVCVSKIPYRTW